MNIKVVSILLFMGMSSIRGFLGNATIPIERILHAESAHIGQYPFMAYVYMMTIKNDCILQGYCGGSIISNSLILSAAHCFTQ